MNRSIGRAPSRRAVLCSFGLMCLILAGCSQTFRQIAIPLPAQTGDPAPLNRALFLATAGTSAPGSVTMVDVPGDTNVGVEQVGVNPVQIGLTFGGGRAVTPNSVDNSASSFQTGVTFGTVNVTSLPTGSGAVFAHSRQGGKFYLALSALNTLGVVDSTLALVAQVPLGSCTNPVAISQVPGGGLIYVACKGAGGVAVVTPSDNVLLPPVTGITGTSPVWIDTSADGKYTFVAEQGSNQVQVICSTSDTTVCAGNTVIATIGVNGAPNFLKYDTHSQRVLVAGAGFVSILDASGTTPTFADIKDLPGSGQTWVTALQDGSRIYVSNAGNDTVNVYSALNFAPIKTITLPAIAPETAPVQPVVIDSDKNSTKVYTANAGTRDFTIIKTLDDTEVFPAQNVRGIPIRLAAPKQDPNCVEPTQPAPPLPLVPGCTRQVPNYVLVLP